MVEDGQPPEISILIVGYNSADFIVDCIASIPSACRTVGYEILLIDNGDGSTEATVSEQFPEVRICPSRGNIGFGSANNLLAKEALSQKLLLLNPDMVVAEGSIDALYAGSLAYNDAAAWGGVTIDTDGKADSGNAIAIPSMAELFSVALGRSLIGSRPIAGQHEDAPVQVLSGAFVMIARSAWEEANGFDERYFLYCEEVDLFYRLAERGHRFWKISSARGYHRTGHGNSASPERLLYRTAGNMQFVRNHWSAPAIWLAGLLMWLGAFERYAAGALLGMWKPRFAVMAKGYRVVATRPDLWLHGYDKQKGLTVQLNQQGATAP